MQTTFKSIHFSESGVKFFENPLYCKPIRTKTPEKPQKVTTDLEPGDKAAESDRNSPTVPGLSRSEQKKALKKAKDKKAKEDKKKASEFKEDAKEQKTQTQFKTRHDFLKKDLVKCKLNFEDIEDEFTFGDGPGDDDPVDMKAKNSKFFGHNSNSDDEDVISPSLANMKEKELMWGKSVESSQNQEKVELS